MRPFVSQAPLLLFLAMLFSAGCNMDIRAGCNMDIRRYCEDWAECVGGNDADEDACVEEYDGLEDVADAYDCEDKFDSYMECLAANSECVLSGDVEYGESYIFDDNNECNDRRENYLECIENASSLCIPYGCIMGNR